MSVYDKYFDQTLQRINPLLDKNGMLRNTKLPYQTLLDSDNTSQTLKRMISLSTGLTQTKKDPYSQYGMKDTSSGNGGFQSANEAATNANTGAPSNKLGFVSAKYEVGGWNPGRVSSGSGDYGGISYGIPQFSTTTGSADDFASYLKQASPEMGSYFDGKKAGTEAFSQAWKTVSEKYGDSFGNLQTKYAYDHYVAPLAKKAKEKTGVDYTSSPALMELLYSTAIQFGGGSLGLSALGNVSPDMSERDIINASYDNKIANYKNYFKSSSANVQESVKNRFQKEREDVLALAK